MSFFISLIPSLNGSLSQGLLWGIMVLGVYITYRILNIADLTVDGSFALGACVCVIVITKYNFHPLIALIFATLSGLIAGLITGILHTFFEIPAILAGILTQISIWSINLGIMGKSNIPLLKSRTIFSDFDKICYFNSNTNIIIIGFIISILSICTLYLFFGTEIGAAIRATGNNEAMLRALGVNIKNTKLLGLMISNGLVALSGGLVAQSQKYADINMGTGAIVIGLASIVIGEVIFSKFINFMFKFTSTIVGCIIYFLIRAIVLKLGLNANYMKAISAILVFIALSLPIISQKIKNYRAYSSNMEVN